MIESEYRSGKSGFTRTRNVTEPVMDLDDDFRQPFADSEPLDSYELSASELDSIEDIIADIRQGKMVILMDDEDRENEGDLIIAAEKVRPDDINFMATHGRGLICLTLTKERCERLRLPLMVQNNESLHNTNFTVSIEAALGVTTGISAHDRAATVHAAVKQDAMPSDIVQPGHIFPLMARPGGVLTRAGHTEAGCDLARLAGFEPAAVIVEILRADGSLARRPDLEKFARTHDIKIGTVADLIKYRLRTEMTVNRVAEAVIPTEFGEFRLCGYEDMIDHSIHIALIKGDVSTGDPVWVRVHVPDTLCDLLGGRRRDCGWTLREALRRLSAKDRAVAVVLRLREDTSDLVDRLRECRPRDECGVDLRTYGLGAQILYDLGVRRMKIIGMRKRFHALSGFGLEIIDYID